MTFFRTTTWPLLALLMIFLAACTAPGEDLPPACPEASVLENADSLTRFREGPGRDLIDVIFTGRMVNLNGSCIYDVDDTDAGVLNMDVSVEVQVNRGTANRNRLAEFDYFVSVLDANGAVLSKEIFPLAIRFIGNATTARETDAPVSLVIPVTAEQISADFRVFVGFQLNPEEVRYNRQKIN
ncbi:MAG TPA: hypothetical protein ENI69_03775 [Rhodospirillales bacterium]|nr:hypothetical protein [Rhodospirillales bacterium]